MSIQQEDQPDYKIKILTTPEEIFEKKGVFAKSKIFQVQTPPTDLKETTICMCRYAPAKKNTKGQYLAEVFNVELKRGGEVQKDKSIIWTLNLEKTKEIGTSGFASKDSSVYTLYYVIIEQIPDYRSVPFYLISKPKKKLRDSPSKTMIPVIEPKNVNVSNKNYNDLLPQPTNPNIINPQILFPGFISDDIINDLSSTELESEFLKYLNLEQTEDEK
eukprot:gene12138-5629_t